MTAKKITQIPVRPPTRKESKAANKSWYRSHHGRRNGIARSLARACR